MKPFTVGIIAGAVCTLSFLPQVIRILKTRNTHDLSLSTFLLFSFGVLLWLCYGILIHDSPVIIANAVTFLLAMIIVALKMRHG